MKDLQQRIEEDELADQAEIAASGDSMVMMTVRDYAKYKKLAPQLVYYHIRQGHIDTAVCPCGRKCIDVASAEAFFKTKADKETTKRTGVNLGR